MAIEEIKAAITEFIDVIEKPKETVAEREKALAIALDKLILFKNFAPDVTSDLEYSDSPTIDYNEVRKKVEELFPNFGYYNEPNKISEEIAETTIVTGDAIDDICDIYLSLKDDDWRFKNTDEAEALWHFAGKDSMSWHWLQHALFLRLYIFSKEYGF